MCILVSLTRKIAATALLALGLSSSAFAQVPAAYPVVRIALPPNIDGVLDDAAWAQLAPMPTGEWVSYNPNRGDRMPDAFRTDVRIAYDDRNIYFAFHCFDDEPDRIRTNVAKRDTAFNDDWFALSLDSAGTRQTAYHLFTNPSGSQMDALNTPASGEQFDADLVWFSAGKTTSDGYIVEMRVPLQTLRFSGGESVQMGLKLFRKVSRIGVSYSWPEMLPGQWVFDQPAHLMFRDLTPRRLVEVLPSVTYNISQERAATDRWAAIDDRTNLGASGKFGITSGITLDGTINPDFSQVESDAFQVQVNQRFPVFFSEKRPFFMEGMGLFNVAGTGGDGNMRTAVHTRRIIDPIFGSKITGTIGKTTFGVLNAADDKPGISNPTRPLAERNKIYTISRATYAFRQSDYLGGIFTHTYHDGRENLVAGGDLSLRVSPTQNFSTTFLASQTTEHLGPSTAGNAVQASYGYETRRINFGSQIEHYDRAFQMDTAFYNRTGFTAGWSFGEINFYPRPGTDFWIQRIHPFYFTKIGHDDVQDGGEAFVNYGVRFNLTRQGFLSISRSRGYEPWQSTRYDVGQDINVFGTMQVFDWLEVNAGSGKGRAIYYDPIDHFQGRSWFADIGVTFQPNQHLTQSLDANWVRFDRADSGGRVFSVDILNSRTTYQFDTHFLVRFLARYDSSARRLLTDLLASYELVPGTVFHVGYGSLFEKRAGQGSTLVPVEFGEQYLSVNRGVFLKASYVHRF
jgi:hypothetical protein